MKGYAITRWILVGGLLGGCLGLFVMFLLYMNSLGTTGSTPLSYFIGAVPVPSTDSAPQEPGSPRLLDKRPRSALESMSYSRFPTSPIGQGGPPVAGGYAPFNSAPHELSSIALDQFAAGDEESALQTVDLIQGGDSQRDTTLMQMIQSRLQLSYPIEPITAYSFPAGGPPPTPRVARLPPPEEVAQTIQLVSTVVGKMSEPHNRADAWRLIADFQFRVGADRAAIRASFGKAVSEAKAMSPPKTTGDDPADLGVIGPAARLPRVSALGGPPPAVISAAPTGDKKGNEPKTTSAADSTPHLDAWHRIGGRLALLWPLGMSVFGALFVGVGKATWEAFSKSIGEGVAKIMGSESVAAMLVERFGKPDPHKQSADSAQTQPAPLAQPASPSSNPSASSSAQLTQSHS